MHANGASSKPCSAIDSRGASELEPGSTGKPILPVCFPFSADIPIGGGHPSAMLLMQSLSQGRIRPVLVLHGTDGPAGRWLAEHGAAFRQARFPAYAGGMSRNLLRDAAFVVAQSRPLARFLKDEAIKIVHANDIWMMLTWAVAARLAGAKLVWHHRSRARFKLAHRLAFFAADRMIAVSPFAAGRRIDDPRCVVIPDPFEVDAAGLDRAAARRALLLEAGLEEPIQLLGFFANLHRPIGERKRPLVVLEALASLKQRAPERAFAAMFFGLVNDAFRARIMATATRLGVERQVFLMGFRTPPDPWLLAVDVVLTPAVDEGFGRVPIEAMLLGTPVIAADSGNHADLVRDGETGGLVPPDDPAALADRILETTSDRAYLARVVRQARKEARERFGAAASARAVSAVYDQLLAGHALPAIQPMRG